MDPRENLERPQLVGEHLMWFEMFDALKDSHLVIPHGPLVKIMGRGQRDIPGHQK